MSLEVNKLKKDLGDLVWVGFLIMEKPMEYFGVKYSVVHFHCSLKFSLF